jgi:hypothetical protein
MATDVRPRPFRDVGLQSAQAQPDRAREYRALLASSAVQATQAAERWSAGSRSLALQFLPNRKVLPDLTSANIKSQLSSVSFFDYF